MKKNRKAQVQDLSMSEFSGYNNEWLKEIVFTLSGGADGIEELLDKKAYDLIASEIVKALEDLEISFKDDVEFEGETFCGIGSEQMEETKRFLELRLVTNDWVEKETDLSEPLYALRRILSYIVPEVMIDVVCYFTDASCIESILGYLVRPIEGRRDIEAIFSVEEAVALGLSCFDESDSLEVFEHKFHKGIREDRETREKLDDRGFVVQEPLKLDENGNFVP